MAWLRFLTIVFVLALSFVAGCNAPLQVELVIPPRRFGISGRILPVPPELQKESRIALLPCTVLPCPDLESWVLECVHEICDPGPREIVLESKDVIDLDLLLREEGAALRLIESAEITQAFYRTVTNSLNFSLAKIELFVGPESAAGLDAPGVARIGVIPPVLEMALGEGEVQIDHNGVQILAAQLAKGERRLRFFLRTFVDIRPGDPIPEGLWEIELRLKLRVSGRIKES